MKIFWPPDLLAKMGELIVDTPIQYRQYVNDQRVRASAEAQAKKNGKSEVDEDSLVRGLITAVPRHLREGIMDVLSIHNYDLMYFRPVFDEPNYLPNPKTSTRPKS